MILEIVVVLNLVKIIDSKQLQLTPVSGMIACSGNEIFISFGSSPFSIFNLVERKCVEKT